MSLTGIHLLLTYRCTRECDHCFVWGSPLQTGVMTLPQIRRIFEQAAALGGISGVAVEGGEPFLYYGTLVEAVREAHGRGWGTEVVTNGYWASSVQDALAALAPLREAGLDAITISEDGYHGDSAGQDTPARVALRAARRLGLPLSVSTIRSPKETVNNPRCGRGDPPGSGPVRFRGRAAGRLTPGMPVRKWDEFAACPDQDLADPQRVHIDPFGFVHLCQGLVMGNLWSTPLAQMVRSFHPQRHPICGPLIRGGPAGLAEAFDLPHREAYVDACHLCYELRDGLRERAPHWLAPAQMYGVVPAPAEA